MKKTTLMAALLLGSSLPTIIHAQTSSPSQTPNPQAVATVIVSATRPSLPSKDEVDSDKIDIGGQLDAASLLSNVPGAAIIHNGTQTGIVQLRGLSQDRIKVRVDGMEITPGCPNHMDPPLHYVMSSQIDELSVVAGVTSVAAGGDSIGGTVTVNTIAPKFSNNNNGEFSGEIGAKYLGANSGYEGALSINLGLEDAAFRYSVATQHGDDFEYARGKASLTGYDSLKQQLDGEMNFGVNKVGFGLGLHNSRNVGTPALEMDMVLDDAVSARLGLIGDYSFGRISARVFTHNIKHIMSNYGLRTYTPIANRMRAPARSIDTGLDVSLETGSDRQKLKFGLIALANEFDVYQENVTSLMVRDLFNGGKRTRTGGFAEWQTMPNQHLRLNIGARFEAVETSVDVVNRIMSPTENAARLAFNGLDRSAKDNNLDLSLAGRWHINDGLIIEFGLAQKTRSPSLVERYLWTPSATYGAADGRRYIGDVALKPEISRQISVSPIIRLGSLNLKPSVFYNAVDDYIQGVAISALPNSDLRFQNIEANLRGAELGFDYAFSENLKLTGNASYVRGKNETLNDNLYRIAPLRGTIALEYNLKNALGIIEVKMADSQNKTSAFNGETPSKAYSILNLKGRYKFTDNFIANFGVENVFDEFYADHLSGKNRVNNLAMGGTLAIGERLPSPGRFGYINLTLSF